MAAATILDNFEWVYLCNGSQSTYTSRGHLCDSTAFLLVFNGEIEDIQYVAAIVTRKLCYRKDDRAMRYK